MAGPGRQTSTTQLFVNLLTSCGTGETTVNMHIFIYAYIYIYTQGLVSWDKENVVRKEVGKKINE